MGQLLVMLIVPPLVGVVTYAIYRFIWERDEAAEQEVGGRRADSMQSERSARKQ
jgi:hypothetical protein